jgi:hypothetical protein
MGFRGNRFVHSNGGLRGSKEAGHALSSGGVSDRIDIQGFIGSIYAAFPEEAGLSVHK